LLFVLERFDFSTHPHVFVVDDGSTDATMEAVRAFPVTILRHSHRRGVGAALRTGLLHLKSEGFDIAVIMAGNHKDDPREIPRLLDAIEGGADYVQGSRFLDGSSSQGTPFKRRLLTRLVAWMWSARFVRRLTEVTNGFRAYRLSLIDAPDVDITQDWLDRYELEFYLHYKVLSLGYRYVEVPVSKRYPQDGQSTSKIRLHRDLWSLIRPIVLLSLRWVR
jgi:dolichol-phosphate mannosyltransferase